jgi:hypothetical protein
MRRIPACWLLSLVLAPLIGRDAFGEDPAWKSKPTAQWSDEDAKAVLAESPWVKHVTPQRLRDLSPFERRDGGNMNAGVGKGVGLAGIGLFGSQREAEALERAHAKPTLDPVVVRWESAPVRAAERKTGETPPAVDDAYYAIVVYSIPAPSRWNLAGELRLGAYLRRYGKKDLKPSRVEILRGEHGSATLVYLFRRSVEITRKDRSVEFVAQIDRLFLEHFFNVEEMALMGELEL